MSLTRPQQIIYNYLMDNATHNNLAQLLYQVQEGFTHVPENVSEAYNVLVGYEYTQIISKASDELLRDKMPGNV